MAVDATPATPQDQMPRVQVLLATYNGEKFLAEQLDSLLAQDYPRLEVLARDDGSSDTTAALLDGYAQRFPDRIRLLRDGLSSGSAQANFERLLQASEAPYVCLCDQDDVWLPHKVTAEMAVMHRLEKTHGGHTPLLVFSDLRVVDEHLRPLHASLWSHESLDPKSIRRLRSVLHQNVVTGCTMLLNRILVQTVLPMPRETPMHDRWIALVTSALGQSGFVRTPLVLYRQHGSNVIGASSDLQTAATLLKRSCSSEGRRKQWGISQSLASALLRLQGEQMPQTQIETVKAFLRCGRDSSRWVRVATMLRYGFFRRGILRNVATMWELWRLKPEDLRVP